MERLKHVREYASQCIRDEAEALLGLIPLLDDNFDKAVELIYNCHGKVIVTGVGKSGHIGAKIAATLSSTGTPSFFINPLDVFHGDLGVMTHDDVTDRRTASFHSYGASHEHPDHRHERQSGIVACQIFICSYKRDGAERGLSSQSRTDEQHYCYARNGRCSGGGADGSA